MPCFRSENKMKAEKNVYRLANVSYVLYWIFTVLYLECAVHYTVYDGFHPRFIYAIGLTAAIACLLSLALLWLPRKARFGITAVCVTALTVLYGSQMVYEFIFGTMYSVAQMGMGGAAVLIDKSFLTDKVWFDANSGEIRYQVPERDIPAGYVENMHRLIKTRFDISSDILNTGYYNFVFAKDAVSVGNDSWKGK